MDKKPSQQKVVDDIYLFLRTIYHYERNIAARFGLDYQEIYLLQNLRRVSPQRLTEIARVLDIPMFSASRLVERLVQKKLITKEKGVEDRRSISVSLLPEGEKVVGLVEQDSYERIMDSAKEMSKEDFASLLQMSERLHQVLGVSKSVIQ